MPTRVKVHIDAGKVRAMACRKLYDWTDDIEDKAKRKVPQETGNLRASISSSVDCALLIGTVRATAPYALAIHEGARPHPIDPVNASVLRFTIAGTVIFARHVDHPGNAAQPFLSDALYEVVARIAAG